MINVKRLQELEACEEQIEKFQEIFGDADAPLSIEVAVKHANVFDWNWAAEHLLSEEGNMNFCRVVAPLWKAYEEAVALHLKTYHEARGPLLKAYNEAEALLWKTYHEARAPFEKAYKEAIASHLRAYRKARAPLLKAYNEATALRWKEYKEAIASHLRAYAEAKVPLEKAYNEATAQKFAEIYISENQ